MSEVIPSKLYLARFNLLGTPLTMPVLTFDFETYHDDEISLSKMPLRKYLAQAPVIGVSFQVDAEKPLWIPVTDPAFYSWLDEIRVMADNPDWIFQGHNAGGFDCRVLRFGIPALGAEPFDVPWPLRIHDSMELSMAAWSCQHKGYSLKNLSEYLHLPPKLSIDDARAGKITWEEYCTRDCANSYEIYRRALERLPPNEIHLAEMANRVRGMHFEIREDQVHKSFTQFSKVAADAVRAIFEHTDQDGELTLGADAEQIFGVDGDGQVKSVRAQAFKKILLERLGFDTQTISKKKINQAKLAAAPEVRELIGHTSQVNRGIFYRRRARDLIGVHQLDMELGYARATNTWRYSSPTTGKGANLHNLAKRDVSVAKPLREMLCLPDDFCFVRADASNVEYRTEGYLTGCQYIRDLFSNDINADPYAAFAYQAFGVKVEKKGPTAPLRQLAKNAVLGLGYAMGLARWMHEMLVTLADPTAGVTLDDINTMCLERNWGPPKDKYIKGAMTKSKAPWQVAVVAAATREAFHNTHHEFFTTATWLERTVGKIAGSVNPQHVIDNCYQLDGAPDRNLVSLEMDYELEYPTVRVRVLGWDVPSITWRHLSCAHEGIDGLGAVTVNKGPRRIYKSILIENICQGAARNMMCKAKLELDKRGWPVIMSVHDEILLVVPRERDAVLKAREDLADVMSPKLGYGWAFYAKRGDISISRSMYEDEDDSKKRWPLIETAHSDMFKDLP